MVRDFAEQPSVLECCTGPHGPRRDPRCAAFGGASDSQCGRYHRLALRKLPRLSPIFLLLKAIGQGYYVAESPGRAI